MLPSLKPQLKPLVRTRSYSSPRPEVQLSVDTNAGKTDSFGTFNYSPNLVTQLESPLALKQHMNLESPMFADFAENLNLDVAAPQFSAPKKDSLIFDFNEALFDL